MLAFYAGQFDTVEVNATFYHLPSKNTIQNWIDTIPDHFLFSVKASRYITHFKKLKDPEDSLEKFMERIAVFGKKLGPILFQLPPNWHRDCNRLSAFIDVLPQTNRYVFEFRDDTWFREDVIRLLEQAGIACCLYDLEGKESPVYLTAEFAYLRLHGPAARYKGSYSKNLLKPWKKRIEEWISGGLSVFVYFNNDFGGHAPENAHSLIGMLESAAESQ